MLHTDICSYSTKRVNAILNYNGANHLIKKEVQCERDQLTHVYTWIICPCAYCSILVDNTEKELGSLYLLGPFATEKFSDPEAKKPHDWDDKEYITDPEDKNPEGYDDIQKEIVAPDAKKADPEELLSTACV